MPTTCRPTLPWNNNCSLVTSYLAAPCTGPELCWPDTATTNQMNCVGERGRGRGGGCPILIIVPDCHTTDHSWLKLSHESNPACWSPHAPCHLTLPAVATRHCRLHTQTADCRSPSRGAGGVKCWRCLFTTTSQSQGRGRGRRAETTGRNLSKQPQIMVPSHPHCDPPYTFLPSVLITRRPAEALNTGLVTTGHRQLFSVPGAGRCN